MYNPLIIVLKTVKTILASTTADLRDRLQEFELKKDNRETRKPKLCRDARKCLKRLMQSGMTKEEPLSEYYLLMKRD